MGLGKSNGGIGGLKPYNKNNNWNRLIKIYFNKNKIINIKYTITIKVTIFIIKENSNAVKSY